MRIQHRDPYCFRFYMKMGVVKSVVLLLAQLVLLSACGDNEDVEQPPSEDYIFSLQVLTPSEVFARAGLVASDLELRVSIAGFTVPMAETPENNTWNGEFVLPTRDAASSDSTALYIAWYKNVEGVSIPLASAETLMLNNASDRNVRVGLFQFTGYDHDSDGSSNLTELAAGTNPLVARVESEELPLDDQQVVNPETTPARVSPDLYAMNSVVFYQENDPNGATSRWGVFRAGENGVWIESKIDVDSLEETRVATFREVQRDESGILLYDVSRDLSILLNISEDKIFWGTGSAANGLLYFIVDDLNSDTLPFEGDLDVAPVQAQPDDDVALVQAQPDDDVALVQAQPDDGLLSGNASSQSANQYDSFVAAFYFESDANGFRTGAGVFRYAGDGTWAEYKIDLDTLEETRFASFGEVLRDSDGILIYDATRNLSIRLAVNAGEIYTGIGDEANGLLYPIVNSIDMVTTLQPTSPEIDDINDAEQDVVIAAIDPIEGALPDGEKSPLYAETVEVFYRQADANEAGVFRYVDDDSWIEYKIDLETPKETQFASYIELRRDGDGIWLIDTTLNLLVILAINSDEIFAGSGDEESVFLFPIVEPIDTSQEKPLPEELAQDSAVVDIADDPLEVDAPAPMPSDAGMNLPIAPDAEMLPSAPSDTEIVSPLPDDIVTPLDDSSQLYVETLEVFYLQSDANEAGVFRYVGSEQWIELKIDTATGIETAFADFVELSRSEGGILLYDAGRDLSIRLDIVSGNIYAGSGMTADGFLMPITDSVSLDAVLPPEDHSQNLLQAAYAHVDAVYYVDRADVVGVFRKKEGDLWEEGKIDINTGDETWFANFQEVRRDTDGILITDSARDLSLLMGIDTGEVFLVAGDVENALLFPIVAIGHSIFFYQNLDVTDPSTVAGFFRLEQDGKWVEYTTDADGNEVEQYRFSAVSQDASNVVIYDQERNISIRLDLLRNEILFGDGLEAFNLLYRIVDAEAAVL